MREQIELLERANEQEKANESLVGALRREAEQRQFQEAAALSALEELRERQHLAAEEGREKAKMLEEREAEIKLQQEAHQRQIAELEAQLAKLQESVESQQVGSPRACLMHVHLFSSVFNGVRRCILNFIGVQWCPLMFIGFHWCPLVSIGVR